MTQISAVTLGLVIITLVASAYNTWRYAWAYGRLQSTVCGLIALISVGTFVVGTFFALVWWIQLEGGYVPMWFRNAWRTTALTCLAGAAVVQSVILLMPNKVTPKRTE